MGELKLRGENIPVMIDQRDLGRSGSLRYNVLTCLREESYDRAVMAIEEFARTPSDFPTFHEKVERYLHHCTSLIRAVEMKRNFPGINRLTVAKQQDLRLKIKQHIDELVYCLKKIERVEATLKLEDIRSTVLIVRAVVLAIFLVAVLSFVVDLSGGMLVNAMVVGDDLFHSFMNWVYSLID